MRTMEVDDMKKDATSKYAIIKSLEWHCEP